jgi:hypothetical protein
MWYKCICWCVKIVPHCKVWELLLNIAVLCQNFFLLHSPTMAAKIAETCSCGWCWRYILCWRRVYCFYLTVNTTGMNCLRIILYLVPFLWWTVTCARFHARCGDYVGCSHWWYTCTVTRLYGSRSSVCQIQYIISPSELLTWFSRWTVMI